MALRRSKTAPQPFDEHDTRLATLIRVKSSINDLLPVHPLSCTPSGYGQDLPRKVVSRSWTPDETEDPFNLAGFFPPSSRVTPSLHEGERWEWLRREARETSPTQDELCSVCSFLEEGGDNVDGSLLSTPGPGVFTRSNEDVAEEVIKRQDKMGVLSLTAIFLTGNLHARGERLYSPYAEEEAVDHESLYLALRKRRRANCAWPVNGGSGSDGEWTDNAGRSAILQWALGIVP